MFGMRRVIRNVMSNARARALAEFTGDAEAVQFAIRNSQSYTQATYKISLQHRYTAARLALAPD